MTERICRICEEPKPLTAFRKNNGRWLRTECRACGNELRRQKALDDMPEIPEVRGTPRRAMAHCEFVMGKDKWMYQGKYFRYFFESRGVWPFGSTWKYRGKLYDVWGVGDDQYIVERKKRKGVRHEAHSRNI